MIEPPNKDVSELPAPVSPALDLVENSQDAIICRTLDGIITNWNSGAQQIYGYSAAEMVGHSTSILFSPDSFGEIAGMLESIKRGESVRRSDTIRVKQGGKNVHVELIHTPIKNALGQVVGISTVSRQPGQEAKQAGEISFLGALINNCLNQLQLLRVAAENHVSGESLVLFDDAIQDASAKLRALGNMEVFAERPTVVGSGLDIGRPLVEDSAAQDTKVR